MSSAIHIVAVGRLGAHLSPAFEHYRSLIAPLAALAVREVREVALQGRAPHEVLREEGRRLSAALAARRNVIALDVGGRAFTSLELAAFLQELLQSGEATFVVGGSLGLADEVKRGARQRLSLSSLTLPHQLVRVVLAEQLFRALKIARGEPYHH